MKSTLVALSLAAALLAGCAASPGRPSGEDLERPEASIPFADQRTSIRDWQADGTQGIWVQDAHRNWYYGRFHIMCFGLDFATAVGFRTGTTGRLDRFSSIEVPGHGRCTLYSFTASEGPPGNEGQDADAGANADAAGSTTP